LIESSTHVQGSRHLKSAELGEFFSIQSKFAISTFANGILPFWFARASERSQ
jgi:hypothetical protein